MGKIIFGRREKILRQASVLPRYEGKLSRHPKHDHVRATTGDARAPIDRGRIVYGEYPKHVSESCRWLTPFLSVIPVKTGIQLLSPGLRLCGEWKGLPTYK